MDPQVALGRDGGAGPVDLDDPPGLGDVAEQHPGPGRVDVEPVGQVAPDPVQEPFGIPLAVELPGPLRSAGVLPPPGPIAAGAACRCSPSVPSHLRQDRVGSSISPQVLRKSSVQRQLSASSDRHGKQRTTHNRNSEAVYRRLGRWGDGESVCRRDSVHRPVPGPDGWPSIYAVYLGTWAGPTVPCSTLLRVGFIEPPGSPRTLVRSYRTVAPLPVTAEAAHRRSVLCDTFLRVAPTGR